MFYYKAFSTIFVNLKYYLVCSDHHKGKQKFYRQLICIFVGNNADTKHPKVF